MESENNEVFHFMKMEMVYMFLSSLYLNDNEKYHLRLKPRITGNTCQILQQLNTHHQLIA